MLIRKALKSDIPSIQEIFTQSILNINENLYSKEQLKDWASCGEDIKKWYERLNKFEFLLAEEKGNVLGFISYDKQGYIDTLFVSHLHQRKGIAQLLLDSISKDFNHLSSHVSIAAKPFFEKNGFIVLKEQLAKANKLKLVNYLMVKE